MVSTVCLAFSALALLPQGGDTCDTAASIVAPTRIVIGDISNSTSGFQGAQPCAGTPVIEIDKFFQWTATEAGDYAFFAKGEGNDPKLALYDGLGCNGICLSYDDDPVRRTALVHYSGAQAGDTALLQYGGAWPFGLGCTNCNYIDVEKLEGDTCSFATDISGYDQRVFELRLHSHSVFVPSPGCTPLDPSMKDRFFRWTATEDGDVWFDTQGSVWDTYIAAHLGGDCQAACVAQAWPASQPGHAKVLVTGLVAGDEVLVQLAADVPDDFNGIDIKLNVYPDSCLAPDAFEPNDSVQAAAALMTGTYTGLNASVNGDDYYRLTVPSGFAAFLEVHGEGIGQPLPQFLDPGGAPFSNSATAPTAPSFVNTTPSTQDYFLRVRTGFFASPCATYGITFSLGPDPCNQPSPGANNDTCVAARPLSAGYHPALVVSNIDPDYYQIEVPAMSTVEVHLGSFEASQKIDLSLRASCSTPPVAYDQDSLGLRWTNQSAQPRTMYLGAQLPRESSNSTYSNACLQFSLALSGGDPIGSAYCGPGVPNSTGQPGTISAQGSLLATDQSLTLRAESVPSFAFGMFVGSQSQGFTISPGGSQGNLCIDGDVCRFVAEAGRVVGSGSGSFQRTLNTASIPEPPHFSTAVISGQTWNFQFWHRDANPGLTSNFTNGVSITFQ